MGRSRRIRPRAHTQCEPVGRTIVALRPMTEEELAAEDWMATAGYVPVVLELDDGGLLYPSRDPEGNGPGALFGRTSEYEPVQFFVREKETR